MPQYWFKLVAMFLMGIVLELFYVAQSSLVTSLGSAETYGERGSAFEGITVIGDMVAPLILGVSLDILGFGGVSYAIAAVALVFGFGYAMVKER